MKTLLALFVTAVLAIAQDGTPVNLSNGVPWLGYQILVYYSGANSIYACYALSNQPKTYTITVSAASNANPVSFTATAHNFGDFANLGATVTPTIKITGYTANWAPLNGVWPIIVTSANAFTVAVDSTGFGAVTGTPVFTTRSPLLNQPVWSIAAAVYSGANRLFSGWGSNPAGAGTAPLVGGNTAANLQCSAKATYSYQ